LLTGLDDYGSHANATALVWGGGEGGKPAVDDLKAGYDGSRPARKWIDAEAPYETRPIVRGRSKMEALFPFGSKGASFYVFAVRTLLFSTAILFCLCVQWIPLSATPHDMLVRIFLSAVPLLMIIVIAPTKLLPLVVMVTSIEQLKNRHDIAETIVEMKAESALQTLRALSIVLSQAVRAKKIGERLQEDEGQKGCLPVSVSCFGPKDEMSASTTSGRETARKRLVLNQQHLSELRATFVCFDKDGSGDIDVEEFSRMLSTLGVRLAPKIASRLFDEMDHNKDGRVEFDEFVEYMVTHGFTSRAESDGPAEIVDCVFEMLDEDHSGTVSSTELRTMMSSLGGNAYETDTTMQMFDLDRSGTITKAELLKAVEMMHTFAAGRRESKRRVITNSSGGLVVVAAELDAEPYTDA
jgi:calmodulin